MRVKKYRLKKEPVIRLVFGLVVFIVALTLVVNYFNGRNTRKLKKIGYNDTQIKVLKDKKVNLTTITRYPYIEVLTSIVENKDYKEENLSRYLTTYQATYDIDTIIYMVNNNLDYEYSEKLASLIHSDYFISSNLDRYMKYTKSNNVGEIVALVNTNNDYEYYTNTSKANISKGKLVLVNKFHYLESDYVPELVKVDNMYANLDGNMMEKNAYEALKELITAADSEGYNIRVNYSYRDYETQEGIYNSYKDKKDEEYADGVSIRPGYSEHQTGLVAEVGVQAKYSKGAFKTSGEYKWMKDNAYKYGFIMRYPEGKEYITGYSSESGHYRYVGLEAAKYIYEHNITFDEYYAYFVENN